MDIVIDYMHIKVFWKAAWNDVRVIWYVVRRENDEREFLLYILKVKRSYIRANGHESSFEVFERIITVTNL